MLSTKNHPKLIKYIYIDLTENKSEEVNLQRNVSGSLVKVTSINIRTKCNQALNLSLIKAPLNRIFKGLLTLHNIVRDRYCKAKGVSPNQVSSQKRVV